MCYVCNCFSWTLDILQRGLTLILSCWLVTAVCCGLFIATMAGIAYGYNYSLAEFITFTRPDVKVYMRRGQFYDRPDFTHPKRRVGDADDIFPFNLSDYQQEVPLGDDSLSEKLIKDMDTKKYAEKLTKYSQEKPVTDFIHDTESPKTTTYKSPAPSRISIIPFHLISTTVMYSGSSEIIMRKFDPPPNTISDVNNDVVRNDDYGVERAEDEFFSNTIEEEDIKRESQTPDIRIRVEDSPIRHSLIMRHWETTEAPTVSDASDVDEEAVVYRAE
ncbi:uncharacterized protein LOC116770434 [Danaus plexippus]|uniref:uncharacterized protein LOC116770434 n=1 Tax=Danaus plexippus TaxID=13037 RepID=UPI002AAFBEC5|nr:uncharacterized protein LOC116770434 [Danaus plexippus]XP_032517797.2 uncharacterized protein LOC116770434 [Danaus plexippus]